MSRSPDMKTRDQLIRSGARQICQASLNDAGYLQTNRKLGDWLIRRSDMPKPRLPKVFVDADEEEEATHVLITVDDYRDLELEGGEFVRRTS